MIMKANKQIGFIYKNNESIDKILKDGDVVFERGFLRERTTTTLPITFGGVGKDLKDYKIYGNTGQTVTTGKNLVDFSNSQGYTYTGGVPSVTTNNIRINSKNSNNINFTYLANGYMGVVSNIMDLEPSTKYIVSFKRSRNTEFYQRLHILNVSNNNEYSLNASINSGAYGNPYSYTFTTSQTGKTAIMISSNNLYPTGQTENVTEIMVRKSNTDNSYEPYTGGQPSPNPDYPQEIVSCGDRTKNLFDINEYSNAILRGGGSAVELTKENDTTLKILNKISQSNNFCGIPIPNSKNLLGKIITASVQVELNNIDNTRMQFYFLSNTTVTTTIGVSTLITSNGTYQLTATIPSSIPSDSTRIGLVIYGSNTAQPVNSYVLWKNIQIEENSSATTYEPYGYKIPVNVNNVITNIYLDEPLRKIDEYSDYIDFINGKVVRNIKEMDMSIITDWRKNNTTPPGYYRISAANEYNLKINKLISNIFKYDSVAWNKNNEIGITNLGNLWITPGDKSLENPSDVPTWLQNKNAYMLGILETPTEESITLPNIPAIDGNNTLNIETEITPSKVYIKYKSNE